MDVRLSELEHALRTAPNAGKPKYAVLRDQLFRQIETGTWQPGEKLPTEADLAKRLPFSLGTIQKAYHELTQDGAILRKRGHGSFVTPKGQMRDPLHCTFLSDEGEVLPIFPSVEAIVRFTASGDLANLFGGKTDLFRIDRRISVNGEFDVWNRFYVTHAIAAPIVSMPRTQLDSANFKLLLGGGDVPQITRIFQKITPGADRLLSDASADITSATVFTVTARAVNREMTSIYVQEMLVPKTERGLMSQVDARPCEAIPAL